MSQLSLKPEEYVRSAGDALLDQVESILVKLPPIACPLEITFTPGMCIRKRTMPADVYVTSWIHRQTSPYVILTGEGIVWSGETGPVHYKAPYYGVTKAGTRRAIKTFTETVWTTFHATDETDLEKLHNLLFFPVDFHPNLNQEKPCQE